MAWVADFMVIQKAPITIGDAARNNTTRRDDDPEEPEISFLVEQNFVTQRDCLLQFEVKGLTVASEDPAVEMNNETVGHISCYSVREAHEYLADNFWFHQTIIVPAGFVKPGKNVLEIAAPSWSGATNQNRYDDFFMRNIVLMYHTDSKK